MANRRVVITGLGIVSPVGNSVTTAWEAIKSGTSGIENIEHFDTTNFSTKFAGLVNDFDAEAVGLNRKDCRKMDLFIQYGIVAAEQAIKDSGLVITEQNATRVGTAIGSGIGGLGLIEQNGLSFVKGFE